MEIISQLPVLILTVVSVLYVRHPLLDMTSFKREKLTRTFKKANRTCLYGNCFYQKAAAVVASKTAFAKKS